MESANIHISESSHTKITYEFYNPTAEPSNLISKNSSKSIFDKKSLFSSFFVFDDGVISINLRSLTILGSVMIWTFLLYILYETYVNQYLPIDLEHPPTISALVGLPIWDKVANLLFIFYAFGIRQANVRCFYKIFYGTVEDSTNNYYYNIGMLTCIVFTAISYFDMY